MRGSACWLVVTPDQRIECPSGHHAVAMLKAAVRARNAQ